MFKSRCLCVRKASNIIKNTNKNNKKLGKSTKHKEQNKQNSKTNQTNTNMHKSKQCIYAFHARYTTNVPGVVVDNLLPLDITPRGLNALSAHSAPCSSPQISLSSILIDFWQKMINTYNPTQRISTHGEDILSFWEILQR